MGGLGESSIRLVEKGNPNFLPLGGIQHRRAFLLKSFWIKTDSFRAGGRIYQEGVLVNFGNIDNLENQEKMSIPDLPPKTVLGFLTVISDAQIGLFGGYLVLNWAGRPLEFHCTAPVKPNRAQQILYGPTLEPYLYGEQIGRTLLSKTQHPPLLICTDVAPVLAVRQYVDRPVLLVLPSPGGGTERDSSETTPGLPEGSRDLVPLPDSRFPSSDIFPHGEEGGSTDAAGLCMDQLGPEKSSTRGAAFSCSRRSAQEPGDRGVVWRLDQPHPGIGRLVGFCWGRQKLAVLENPQEDYPQVQEALAGLEESFDLAEPFSRIRDAIEEARRGG